MWADLSPTEAAIVARFEAAPPLPELDADRVQQMAGDLSSFLTGWAWPQVSEADRVRFLDLARYALTVPGVAP